MNFKTLMFAVAALATISLSSCSNDDNEGSSSVNPDLNGTDAMVSAACDNWKSARQDWEWSEAFLFGAAGDYAIDPHIDTWPFDRTMFDNYMKKYNPATNESDAAIIDQAIATGQNLTGFHAVEYLLFREGNARKIADLNADEVYFCQSATSDLYLNALKLVAAWGGTISSAEDKILEEAEFESKDYGEDFMNAGQAGSSYSSVTLATRQIIAGCQDIIGEVRDSKIGAPATGEDINYIESPYSYNSIQDFYDNIMSCKHALYGGWNITGSPASSSLIGVCLNVNQLKSAAENVQNKLDAALVAVSNMKKPFVLYYSDASAKNAMTALDALDEALSALDEAIEPYSSQETLVALFKTVNKEFVENTVRPTYRSLADHTKAMLTALTQITWK